MKDFFQGRHDTEAIEEEQKRQPRIENGREESLKSYVP